MQITLTLQLHTVKVTYIHLLLNYLDTLAMGTHIYTEILNLVEALKLLVVILHTVDTWYRQIEHDNKILNTYVVDRLHGTDVAL